MITRIALTLFLLFLFRTNGISEDNFEPIPLSLKSAYHFDLGKLFFKDDEIEKSERLAYYNSLSNLEHLKGKVTNSANNLLTAFSNYDEALLQYMKHYTYFYLRSAVNTSDKTSAQQASQLSEEFSRRTSFLQTELLQLDKTRLQDFLQQSPALKAYSFAIDSFLRNRSHTFSLEGEELESSLHPLSSEWQFELYQQILSRTNFEDLTIDGEKLNVYRNRASIAVNPNRAIREQGFKKLYEGYFRGRDLHAFALIKLVQAGNHTAQLRHFEDLPDQIYFNSYWTKREVQSLLNRIADAASVYKNYQQLKANKVRKGEHLTNVNSWDMGAGSVSAPRFTIQETTEIIKQALLPLGSEYARELAMLLEPKNGRLDIVSGLNRKGGGFSKGFPNVPTVFYSSGFNGYYNDVRVLMHESTHAIHRQLMKNNQVLPMYAEGPHYLFESFAIFNELLLSDYLYAHEKNSALRDFYLEQFLDGKGMALFFTAQDAMLEGKIYEGVESDTIQGADDLDALTLKISNQFSIWSAINNELRMRWITNSLFYEDPLYNINYVYGSLLALKYYDLFLKDEKDFVPNYIALMRNGFDAEPSALLKRFLNIDLNDPDMLRSAIALLSGKVQQLHNELGS
jgi:oligoendopeptidase F